MRTIDFRITCEVIFYAHILMHRNNVPPLGGGVGGDVATNPYAFQLSKLCVHDYWVSNVDACPDSKCGVALALMHVDSGHSPTTTTN